MHAVDFRLISLEMDSGNNAWTVQITCDPVDYRQILVYFWKLSNTPYVSGAVVELIWRII